MAAALIAALGLMAAPPARAAAPCGATAPTGGDWPAYGHDAANSRSQPLQRLLTPKVVPGLAAKWVFSTAKTGRRLLVVTPVVARGCVFVGSTGSGVAIAEHTVFVADTGTGTRAT